MNIQQKNITNWNIFNSYLFLWNSLEKIPKKGSKDLASFFNSTNCPFFINLMWCRKYNWYIVCHTYQKDLHTDNFYYSNSFESCYSNYTTYMLQRVSLDTYFVDKNIYNTYYSLQIKNVTNIIYLSIFLVFDIIYIVFDALEFFRR